MGRRMRSRSWSVGYDHSGRYHYGDARRSSSRDERRGCENRPLNPTKGGVSLMKKQEVRALIEKIGIVPVIRTSSREEARFAAEAVWQGGIPIVEITMTVPGALDLIS